MSSSVDSSDSNKRPNAALHRQIFAGIAGSIATTTLLNPINVVKVRIQAGQGTIAQVMKLVVEERGLAGYYSGVRVGIAQSLPSIVIYMSCYEQLRDAITPHLSLTSQQFAPALSGAIARTVVVSAVSPLELFRTVQLSGNKNTILQIAKAIYTKEGIAGFYKGWASTVLRDTPYSAVYWFAFESYRTAINSRNRNNGMTLAEASLHRPPLSAPLTFLGGALSGCLSALLTHPFDVLKTQSQLQGKCDKLTCQLPQHRCSVLKGLRIIYGSAGIAGLYRGLTVRLATIIPGSAIMITVYEGVKNYGLN